jgi:hypothetical protein
MEEDGFDDPPMKIKKIDVSSLGTLGKMSNTWYEVEEKEDDDDEEDQDEEEKLEKHQQQRQGVGDDMEGEEEIAIDIKQKSIDTSILGTLSSQANTWYQNEEEDGDEAEELEGEEEQDEEIPEINALQLMNTPIEQLIDTTNNLEGLLTALLVYSKNLNRAVQHRLNSIPK